MPPLHYFGKGFRKGKLEKLFWLHFCPGVAQANGEVEDGTAVRRVLILHKIALAHKLEAVTNLGCL